MVIKRDGRKVDFDITKIARAVSKAFIEVEGELDEGIISYICDTLSSYSDEDISVEQIQDKVEDLLMDTKYKDVARAYIRYRYKREQARTLQNDLQKRYNKIKQLISGNDEESNKENSNKDTRIVPTMRDYIAGFTCRELAEKVLLPADVAKAHKAGIIHVHDTDYSPAMPIGNCCLINLDDMLQNGTIISGSSIHKPHSLRTASTLMTQIITQVASCQYGGCTVSLAHLAPFVEESRKHLRYRHPEFNSEQIESLIMDEIRDSIQTIQYQLITMSTTNGQFGPLKKKFFR